MPDEPSAPRDEVASLRAANARLREVIEARDTEVAALRNAYQAQVEALRVQVEALRVEVAELRARLGQNPRSSSRPPSSEGLAKPAPKSLRKRTGRKPGRPKGQPGATLEMADHPDEVRVHEPPQAHPGYPKSHKGDHAQPRHPASRDLSSYFSESAGVPPPQDEEASALDGEGIRPCWS